ncbi:MAG: sugar transferase [Patescibacteria group bacterium]|mgnify:FL=1
MKRRIDLLFAALLVPLDYASLLAAGWLAYTLRFRQITSLLPIVDTVPFGTYARLLVIVAIGWVAVLALAGVYRLRQPVSSELGRIFLGASTAVLLVIVFIFFRREFFASRFIILAGWVLAVIMLWLVHLLVRGLQRLLLRRGIGARQVVLFGHDRTAEEIVRMFRHQPGMGYQVRQAWAEVSLDSLAAVDDLLKTGTIDEVIQADPTIPKAQTLQLLERCTDHGVTFTYAADVFDTQAGNVVFRDLAGVPMIEIKRTPLDGWGRILKRTLDLALGWLAAMAAFVPGLIVAIIIKLDSAGPVFVRLDRVGQGQRKFKLWKFRSMIRDAHALKPQLLARNERADGPLFKITRDPRITRVGRFIRKTSIDEVPQLINVIRGQMSLVGPRPHEPEEVARYDAGHKKLLTIKPGMTGMAQVSGRSNLSFEEEVQLDTYYIEHWSLGLDLAILLRTPLAVIRTDTAA